MNPASRIYPGWPVSLLIIQEEYEMPKRTIHDRLVAALEAQGHARPASPLTRKFTVLIREWKPSGIVTHFYVGRNGALRTGSTLSGSIPCNAAFKAQLLATQP